MSEERMFGWRSRNGVIENVGAFPMQVRKLDVTIQRKSGRPLGRATALDANGHATKKIELDGSTLRVPEDSIYCVLERG